MAIILNEPKGFFMGPAAQRFAHYIILRGAAASSLRSSG